MAAGSGKEASRELFRVSAEGLAHLAGLVRLTHLDLGRAKVTDDAMVQIGTMKNLKSLSLEATPIGDAGMAHLADLPQLEVLDMKRTRITDASLPHLIKLKTLRNFNPIETGLSRNGEAVLRLANPQLNIAIDAPP